MHELLSRIRACRLCEHKLEPHPIVAFSPSIQLLIIGQAPGSKVHASGIPWDDASGTRLREWLGMDTTTFYDETAVGIMPMGFCYPGKGSSGDLPPAPECAQQWHQALIAHAPNIKLTLLIGQYAQQYYLGNTAEKTLTATVQNWRHYLQGDIVYLPLPHPSPRNNIWLKKNAWFEEEVLPYLHDVIASITEANT